MNNYPIYVFLKIYEKHLRKSLIAVYRITNIYL